MVKAIQTAPLPPVVKSAAVKTPAKTPEMINAT